MTTILANEVNIMSGSATTKNHATTHDVPFNLPIVGMLLFLTGIPGIPAILLIVLVLLGASGMDGSQSIVNPLHFDTPAAILVHGGSGVLFFLTMPFQFSPRLRRKYIKWHRTGGVIATVSAFIMAISGVWMHHVLSPGEFGMRYSSLWITSLGICLCFALGLKYIFQKNIAAHRKWMARGVAVVLAAVTPLFVDGIIAIGFSHQESTLHLLQELQHDYGRLLGIVLNLSILESVRYFRHSKEAKQDYKVLLTQSQ